MCFCAALLPCTNLYRRLECERLCCGCVDDECHMIDVLAREDLANLCCCVEKIKREALCDPWCCIPAAEVMPPI